MTECYECSRLAELVTQNTALKVERDQWREAAGNAHDMWEKAATERDEWKAKAEQVQESYLDAKSDRDAWKAKAESYMSDAADQQNPRSQEADSAEPASSEGENLAGLSNLEWLMENDREELAAMAASCCECEYCAHRDTPECNSDATFGGNDCYGGNREWLMSEHVDANDALAPENGVSAEDVDSNDANADSREKLEADVREWCGDIRWGYETIFKWLDRQALITERELGKRATFGDRIYFVDRISELEAENAKLEERANENSRGWEMANQGWADAIVEAEKWRDKYRWLSAKCKVALG